MQLKRSFRAVADALDEIPDSEARDFLARLVLLLAHELNDADRFEQAIQRAKATLETTEKTR